MKRRKQILALLLSAAISGTCITPVLGAENVFFEDGEAEELSGVFQEPPVTDISVQEPNQDELPSEEPQQQESSVQEPSQEEPSAEEPAQEILFQENDGFQADDVTEVNGETTDGEDKSQEETFSIKKEELDGKVVVWMEWYQGDTCIRRYRWEEDGTWHQFDPEDASKEIAFGASGIYELAEAEGVPMYWYLDTSDPAGAKAEGGYIWNETSQKFEYFLEKDTTEEELAVYRQKLFGMLGDMPSQVCIGTLGDISLHSGLQTIGEEIFYLESDGSLFKNGDKTVDGKVYTFGENGECTGSYTPVKEGWVKRSNGGYYWRLSNNTFVKGGGWKELGGQVYWLYTTGRRRSGWVTYEGTRYYLDPANNDVRAEGWRKIGNYYYYFMPDTGAMKTGWVTVGKSRYYLDSNGRRISGWRKIGNYYYYFDTTTGVMKTGMVTVSGKRYYLRSNGTRATGWVKGTKYTYYFNPTTGAAVTGSQKIDGKMYYFDTRLYYMKSGMVIVGNKRYYYGKDGVRVTGWVKGAKYTYYFDPTTGAAVTGRQTIDGKEYYMYSNGIRAEDRWVNLGGKYYFYKKDTGVLCKNGWLVWNGGKYFLDPNGARVTGLTKIGGKTYYFLSNGKLVTSKTNYKIGNIYYNIDSSGVATAAMSRAESLANDKLNEIGRSLEAAFNWSASIPYYNNSDVVPAGYTEADYFGIYGFENSRGNCYVMACTFYQMAKVLGYDVHFMKGSVPLAGGGYGPHGWCEIDMNGGTYVFDPNFTADEGRNGFMFTYGTPGTWIYSGGYRVN